MLKLYVFLKLDRVCYSRARSPLLFYHKNFICLADLICKKVRGDSGRERYVYDPMFGDNPILTSEFIKSYQNMNPKGIKLSKK